MKTDVYLIFRGECREAFAFYEATFQSKIAMTMTYGDAPGGSPVPDEMKDMVMHTSMPLGSVLLMGSDDMRAEARPMGGFQISVNLSDEAEVKRLFEALSDGGSVTTPLAATFWSPLFGMCTDKFGVAWMVSLPGPEM